LQEFPDGVTWLDAAQTTEMYQNTERYKKAIEAFKEAATLDIQLVEEAPQAKTMVELDPSADQTSSQKVPYSVIYHKKLHHYVQELCRKLLAP
jgi:hypothetical protein